MLMLRTSLTCAALAAASAPSFAFQTEVAQLRPGDIASDAFGSAVDLDGN